MLHIGTTHFWVELPYGNQAPYNVTLPTIRVRTTGTLDSLPLFYLHSNEIAPPSSETTKIYSIAKALYAFHPEQDIDYPECMMKGASTILIDANLYFLAWLYFIDRGVSGRASAFNQTGTGQDEKQNWEENVPYLGIGMLRDGSWNGPVLGATTIGRIFFPLDLLGMPNKQAYGPLGSGKQITITGTWEHTDGMNKIRTILGCNLIMSEFVDHAIEDFVRNIEFTLSFLQPILWNLFFQHMSSLENF
ncbi:hypothetical protein ACJX0J_000761 (mitochondrion) [Zea mays]